ncbi:hypothetical protein PHYPSEUDO_013231 [Phytophthora pseudosyringae]|uniref:PDZ domain-containing protein n=1 Tax=Phytophthora pseudosyringae TaxID=221518 RepID=A0A8T1VAE1_9STRA|nr:hypothetical protein PHYPSEUDO_013231 [Phytophthora pseudosyringae]
MYAPHSIRSQRLPPSSRRSSAGAAADAPLTAERAMMDQIRSKLERAQRRLARNAPGSSGSSSSAYIPSSDYSSAAHKAPVKSVLMEDMPATASRLYAPPPSSSRRHQHLHGTPPPPSTARHHHGMPPPPSSRRPPLSSRYDLGSSRQHSRYPESARYSQQQYKSRSKYPHGDADPLNGGPPPMSTPYLVYSGSQHVKSGRVPLSKAPPTDRREHKRPEEEKHRHREPPSSTFSAAMNGPPSAMRSGLARPPSDSEYLSSGYSMFEAHVVEVDVDLDAYSDDDSDEETETEEDNVSNQVPEAEEEDEDVPTPPATELSTVKEEAEEEQAPVSRLTARDLAFHALGRTSSCSLSDLGSPVPSANGKESQKYVPTPMSYTPASSAFPPSRALRRSAVPATTGRTRGNRIPPAPSTSVASYVRRSRARAPMDLKNQLPPSIGVLSGLSSGSSTFVMDPSYFYEVTWKSGEFAFSVQRVYTDENEFEFDDRNQEPQLFLRMLLDTERSTCKSFHDVRVGDVLIRVGDANVSELGLEGSGTVLTKFFAKMMAQTPIKLTFQRMCPSDWEGGVEL